ncbi:MAG: SHOCT domain-containing protein [Bacteroidia bacterium]|nr:SHOCT domain-containing protein [Bacteroidia bacterium]
MKQKAFIKPTKSGLVVGIIAAAAMLVFGIFFFAVLTEEGAGIGQVFMIFWIFMVLVIGGYYTYSLINYDKNSDAGVGGVIEMDNASNIREIETSFDDKLRKLENLRKEGLINDAEFAAKRQEIMEQKW